MLTIRNSQMAALESSFRASLKRSVIDEILSGAPDPPALEARARISAFVDRAEAVIDGYRGDLVADLRRLSVVLLEHGAGFPADTAWAAEVLDDEQVPAEAKVDVIEVLAAVYRAQGPST